MSKSKIINVRGTSEITDPFYRYKMESVNIIDQGIKIVFTNIDSICTSINRTPQQLVSFLKKYYGTSFEYKNNVAWTTKKDLTKNSLQDAIYQFIEQFVLCKNSNCRNPETVITKTKKETYFVCGACSNKSILN